MKLIFLEFFLVSSLFSRTNSHWFHSSVPSPDEHRDLEALIASRGYTSTTHSVITKDGYILNLYRISNPRRKSTGGLKPVVLQHGLLAAATDWVIGSAQAGLPADLIQKIEKENATIPKGLGNNLAYVLSDLGYDVWLANSRGTKYSRDHVVLNPDEDPEFWRYSFDEMIMFDTPAVVDYVLNTTSRESLAWVGHSQGGLMMFGLLATHPEYAEKVKPFIALAPACYVGNISTIFKVLSQSRFLEKIFSVEPKEIFTTRFVTGEIVKHFCDGRLEGICAEVLNILFHNQFDNLDPDRLAVYGEHYPAGTSTINFVHWSQSIRKNSFAMFDYGRRGNRERYGSKTPPVYDLSNVISENIAVLWSQSDALVSPKDIKRLISQLKVPLLRDYRIPAENWTHLNFIFGPEVGYYVNNAIVQILRDSHS